MAENKNQVSLAGLRAELRSLCEHNETGRLVVLADTNRFLSFDINQGNIVAVNYGQLKGREALEKAASEFNLGRTTFMAASQPKDELDTLPPADEIWAILGVNAGSDVADSSTIGAEHKDALTQILGDVIGPMASIVAANALAKAATVDQAIDAMATEISNHTQASEFIARARHQVGQSTPAATEPVVSTESSASQALTDDQKAQLKQALTEAIGPMANIIGDNILAKASSVENAIERLAAEIPDVSQAAAFKAQAEQLIS